MGNASRRRASRGPSKSRKRKLGACLLVYGVPFLALEAWGYLREVAFLEYLGWNDPSPHAREHTIKVLWLPFAVALEDWRNALFVLALLAAMAVHAVRPHPATALVSVLGVMGWLLSGWVILGTGI